MKKITLLTLIALLSVTALTVVATQPEAEVVPDPQEAITPIDDSSMDAVQSELESPFLEASVVLSPICGDPCWDPGAVTGCIDPSGPYLFVPCVCSGGIWQCNDFN